MLRTLLFAAVFVVASLISLPAHAGMTIPVPYNDECTYLSQKIGDPFIERDFERCQFAENAIGGIRSPARENSFKEYCAWLGGRMHRPQLATDTNACAKEATRVSTEETMSWNHPNRVAMRDFLKSLPLDGHKTMCEWLANEKYGRKILTGEENIYNGSCVEFQRKQYAENPAQSLADYKAYCAYLGHELPMLSAADAVRFCPDIDKEMRLKNNLSASADKRHQEQAAKDRAATMIWIIALIGAGLVGFYLFFVLPKQRTAAQANARRILYRKRMDAALAGAGNTPDERAARMTNSFDQRDATLNYVEDGDLATLDAEAFAEMRFELTRTITTMEPSEITALRILYLLANADLVAPNWFDRQRFALIYGDGKASVRGWRYQGAKEFNQQMPDIATALGIYARRRGVTTSSAVSDVLGRLRDLEHERPNDPLIIKLRKLVIGGGEWLGQDELGRSIFNSDKDLQNNLLLGVLPNDEGLHYKGEGSLITFAPPGSGKSQCHVIPNLLTWGSAALVLDVKDELYRQTRNWRDRKVGPIYRFAPHDPESSHCFNPLLSVRGDRFNVWEDSLYLADLFMVDTGDQDKFWSSRARDILAAAIALTCYGVPPEERSMGKVHAIANRVDWGNFVADLISTRDVVSMSEEGSTLSKAEDKTLDGILQSLKVTLQPWAGERMRHVTRRSDWKPLDLRSNQKPTIYACIPPGQIKSMASVLRVLVGTHLRALTAELPARGASPILFMLDELPQLGHMAPVADALDTGRQYGIQLWMFAQNIGQMEERYKNAKGMIGSCAVQAYMNPSLHDGTAEKISAMLGERRGALDRERRRVLDASEIAGPEYKEGVFVFGANSPPALVGKIYAHSNPEYKRRMDLPPREAGKSSKQA